MFITIKSNTDATEDEIRSSEVLKYWVYGLPAEWTLNGIHVNDVLKIGGTIRMIQMVVDLVDEEGVSLPGFITLRGEMTDCLAIVMCEGEAYVVFVRQPRAAACGCVLSNPAGMIDPGDKSVRFRALEELAEELGISLEWEYVAMSKPLLVSPGGIDEKSSFGRAHADVEQETLSKLQGNKGGLVDEGEQTQVVVVPIEEAVVTIMAESSPCLKTLFSLMLYYMQGIGEMEELQMRSA